MVPFMDNLLLSDSLLISSIAQKLYDPSQEIITYRGSEMTETKEFHAPAINTEDAAKVVSDWLDSQGYDTQTLPASDGSIVVQARKSGMLRKAVGMSTALGVTIKKTGDALIVETGAAKWTDKAAVGAIGVVFFPPAMATAAYGAWKQSKLPDQVFQVLETYISGGATTPFSLQKTTLSMSEKTLGARGLSAKDVLFFANGSNGQIYLTAQGVLIAREGSTFRKLASGNLTKGDKQILYKNITAVQFKDPGMTRGYIQFTLIGGLESRGGVFDAISDENTVLFDKADLDTFREVRRIVEEKIQGPPVAPSSVVQVASMPSTAEEIAKLSKLLQDGLITQEEFIQLKRKIIDGK